MTAGEASDPPTVSVLLSARNEERYLSAAIRSILGQSLADFEFLIVDDCSTDRTPDIIAEHAKADARIRPLTGNGQGLAAALNLGLRHARGSLIARMDGDDIAMPDRLDHQVTRIQAEPQLIVLGSWVDLIDAEGARIRTRRAATDSGAITQAMPVRNVMCHPSCMIRAGALRQMGGYREQFRTAEDYDLWLRMLGIGTFANIDRPLLQYRKHDARTSAASKLGRTTLYSVGAALDHFRRRAGHGCTEAELAALLDPSQPDNLAAALQAMLHSDLPAAGKRQLMRHVLRFLRLVPGITVSHRRALLAAAKPYMTLKDRIKAAIYRV